MSIEEIQNGILCSDTTRQFQVTCFQKTALPFVFGLQVFPPLYGAILKSACMVLSLRVRNLFSFVQSTHIRA